MTEYESNTFTNRIIPNEDDVGGCDVMEQDSLCVSDFTSDSSWDVFMFDDDYTPINYVWNVLSSVFEYDMISAIMLAETIQENGKWVVGSYPTMDEAYDKIEAVNNLNKNFGFMLRVEAVEKSNN